MGGWIVDGWVSGWMVGGWMDIWKDERRNGLKDDPASRDGGMGWFQKKWLDLDSQKTAESLGEEGTLRG